MKYILSFIFYLALFCTAKAQSSYAEAMQQGDTAFKNSHYKTALNKYFAAEAFSPLNWEIVK